MIEAAAARLRQLARDHASGELDFATYRRLRGELLDSLVAVSAQAEDDNVAPLHAAPTSALATIPQRRRRIIRTSVWSVIALSVLGGAAWLATERGLITAGTWRAMLPRIDAANADSSARSAQRVVEAFLSERDWSDARLAQLHGAWRSLPEAARQSARGTSWHHELTDAIRLRIKEQRALADSPEALRLSPSLMMLAREFGVENAAGESVQRVHSGFSAAAGDEPQREGAMNSAQRR